MDTCVSADVIDVNFEYSFKFSSKGALLMHAHMRQVLICLENVDFDMTFNNYPARLGKLNNKKFQVV